VISTSPTKKKLELETENKKPTATDMIPFHHTISNKTNTLLKKHSIRTIHIPTRKTAQMLKPAKDGLELKVPGVHRISCAENICRTERQKFWHEVQHPRCICLHQPEKSAVAEHRISRDDCIDFSGISILDRKKRYVDRLVKEAIEIHLNKNNFNTGGGFISSQAWLPITSMLMKAEARSRRVRTSLRPPTVLSRQVYHDAGGLRR
jgi:hypothetical protein